VLTTSPRTATVVAESTVWALALNTAEFESFVAFNPAVGMRLMRVLAQRVLAERIRGG